MNVKIVDQRKVKINAETSDFIRELDVLQKMYQIEDTKSYGEIPTPFSIIT